MKRPFIPIAVAAVLLLTAACGDDDDNGAAEVDNVSSDASSGGLTSSPGETIDATPGEDVLATVAGEVPRGVNRDGRVPLRVDIVSLERTGDLVNLVLLVTNEDDVNDYKPYSSAWGADSFRLIDQANERVYLTAEDGDGDCLCNTSADRLELDPGDSAQLYARYAGVPEDVTSVDIQTPHFAPIVGVPVSG